MRRSSRAPAVAAVIALTVVLAIAGTYGCFHLIMAKRVEALSARLDATIDLLRAHRIERPPHRGPARSFDAVATRRAAAAHLPSPPTTDMSVLGQAISHGLPLPSELEQYLRKEREKIIALSEAARGSFVSDPTPFASRRWSTMPDLRPANQANLMLLAVARGEPPGRCLELAVDAVRMGHDTGLGVVPLALTEVAIRNAARVIVDCAARANAADVARAASELRVILAFAPAIGEAIAFDSASLAIEMRAHLENTSILGSHLPPLGALIDRYEVIELWRDVLSSPERWLALSRRDYPDLFAEIAAHPGAAPTSYVGAASYVSTNYTKFAEREALGRARLRALVLALEAMDGSPTRADRAAPLHDPFDGEPMRYRAATPETPAAFYSIGFDRRDDHGTPQAPSNQVEARGDVVVEVPAATGAETVTPAGTATLPL